MKTFVFLVLVSVILTIPRFLAAQDKSFVPDGFTPPVAFETEFFHFRSLSHSDPRIDENYKMNAYHYLPERVPHMGAWHRLDVPMGDDLIGHAYYDRIPQNKDSFVYPVLKKGEENMIGSIYIRPSKNAEYDAQITMWLRIDDSAANEAFYKTVREWIDKEWPFKNPDFSSQSIRIAKK
ncbi:MAG: hypothetical protein ABR597_10615 [Bacteroidales bacterium]